MITHPDDANTVFDLEDNILVLWYRGHVESVFISGTWPRVQDDCLYGTVSSRLPVYQG